MRSGAGSSTSLANLDAVHAFLTMHNMSVEVVEELTHGQVETFHLGHGNTCLGTLLWDTHKQHVDIVDRTAFSHCFQTCVRSFPWARSAVGTDDLPSSVKLFKPLNTSAEVNPDGYFLIDSFHYFKKDQKENRVIFATLACRVTATYRPHHFCIVLRRCITGTSM